MREKIDLLENKLEKKDLEIQNLTQANLTNNDAYETNSDTNTPGEKFSEKEKEKTELKEALVKVLSLLQ